MNGLRILNTRPLEQGLALHQSILDAGGISIQCPTLAIEPTPQEWLNALVPLSQVQYAIFISANAVLYFYTVLEQQQILWPSTIQTLAIGNATAEALKKWRIRVDYQPLEANSEHFLKLKVLQKIKNQTLLLVKGEGGRVSIQNTLMEREANLISLNVYRRVLPYPPPTIVHSLWQERLVDIILFTSEQSIKNLFILFGEDAHAWLCNIPCVVISERLAKAAYQMGMQTVIVSRYDMVLNTLEKYYKNVIAYKA